MPDFNVSGNMKVKTLQANYKKAYGGTLRVYKGNQFADPDTTLSNIRAADSKGGEISVNGRMLVENFEKKFKDTFGIKVKVANQDNSKLSDDKDSLTEAGKK